VETCFETAQSRENDGVALGGVRLGKVVEVLVGVDWLPVLIESCLRDEVDVLVLIDGPLHAINSEKTPFIDGHFVDEVALGKIARTEVAARGLDESGEPWDALGAYGEDAEVDVEGHGRCRVV